MPNLKVKKTNREKTDTDDSRNPRLSSVTTAIRLLKQFSEENEELGISTLSRNLGVAKSTVHRVASTLVYEGLLEQDSETELYRLGLGLFNLGALVRRRLSVTSVAKELLTEMRDQLKENVELAVLKGYDVTYMWDFESPLAVRLRPRLGISVPAVDCAVGMTILAFQPDTVIEKFIDATRLPITPARIDEIKSEIKSIRANGYAAETENFELGAICVAAPVFNANGSVTSAIGVSVPHQRVDPKLIEHLAKEVVRVSHSISRRMGYTPEKSQLFG